LHILQHNAGHLAQCAASVIAASIICLTVPSVLLAQQASRTLVAIFAHADDETPAGPILARYAREGAKVYMIIASDGAQGTATLAPSDSARIKDIARERADEARCAASALGTEPPIILGFPDGKLGDFIADRSLTFRLTARIAAELERLRPDALMTWGPDGGFGHPDHRIVSDVVTQIVRAAAPGATERLFYMFIPPEGFLAAYPQRAVPAHVAPHPKWLTMRVSFTPQDLDASRRAMACHRSQFTPEMLARVVPQQERYWNGVVPFAPAISGMGGTSLFR
jgi:LmbE family N-acetylglucosaminyl deacetylase